MLLLSLFLFYSDPKEYCRILLHKQYGQKVWDHTEKLFALLHWNLGINRVEHSTKVHIYALFLGH